MHFHLYLVAKIVVVADTKSEWLAIHIHMRVSSISFWILLSFANDLELT